MPSITDQHDDEHHDVQAKPKRPPPAQLPHYVARRTTAIRVGDIETP